MVETARVVERNWDRRPRRSEEQDHTMNIFLLIIAIVAVVLLLTGGFVSAVQWLLWVGIVLLVIAAIVFLLRFITGNRTR